MFTTQAETSWRPDQNACKLNAELDTRQATTILSRHMAHPYQEYEGTPLWSTLDKEIAALEKNGDLELTTARQYVIGWLCKSLNKAGLVTAATR